jgi:predicted short-subunit dehydrogenase-like oxidoreductase (DUF2520 family)
MKKKIESIVFIGAGNVANHLAIELSKHVSIKGILSKNHHSSKILADQLKTNFISKIEDIPSCDLVLICTNDSAICSIEEELPLHFTVAYTSGSVELNTKTKRDNFGVFYPLQTFSKTRKIDLSVVPFLIEATNSSFQESLVALALTISNSVSLVSSAERKHLHISAVFINNFTNHLAEIAKDYTLQQNLKWEYLLPLIQETTSKLIDIGPENAQTGPAKRNDQLIINEHLSMLHGYPKEIYKLLSKSILNTYSKL